jgi:hypothetical protein
VLLSIFAVPILGFVTVYLTSASFRAFTETIPMTLLVGSHLGGSSESGSSRVARWVALPRASVIPEGFGDIIAALGAAPSPAVAPPGAPRSRGWLLA